MAARNRHRSERSKGFHSIRIPSEWGWGDGLQRRQEHFERFHSIRIPSEWGYMWGVSTYFPRRKDVSIQLGSPASGDSEELEAAIANLPEEFPFN